MGRARKEWSCLAKSCERPDHHARPGDALDEELGLDGLGP
jgi:hypothetical protein